MAFEFQEASTVIAGTFNIYIISPGWLGAIGELTEQTQVHFQSQLEQPGFRISSPALRTSWAVFPDRVVLQTNDPDVDCGEVAFKVLDYLPWTPLKGLGTNVLFTGEQDSFEGWDEKTAFPSRQDDTVQRVWHIARKRGDQVFNLQVTDAVTTGRVEIRANIHTELSQKTIDDAKDASRNFRNHINEAVGMLRQDFGATIDWGIN